MAVTEFQTLLVDFALTHTLFLKHTHSLRPAQLTEETPAVVTCVAEWAGACRGRPLPEPAGRVDSANVITKAWHRIVTQDNWPAVAAQQREM